MSDLRNRQQIETPCIKVCVIHPQTRLCSGCLRSIDEITAWTRMTPEERRRIMAALPSRARLLPRPHGERSRRPGDEAG